MSHCLIPALELAQGLTDPNWVILDCRHDLMNPDAGRAAYAAGHIPGALFASIDHDLAGPKIGAEGQFLGRHPLPDIHTFITTLQHWGISNDTTVIAYDDHGGMYAARLWWMLRWVGHANVRVLDGGLTAWKAHGILSPLPTQKEIGTIQIRPSLCKTVSAADILANLIDPTLTVLDARAPDRFRGENEIIDPVGGHIPGAKNRFFKDNLQANGQFKSASQLRTEFSALLPQAEQGIMQCGSGVTACHHLLALDIAGLSGAALYPGSWSEWCADTRRPVAIGA